MNATLGASALSVGVKDATHLYKTTYEVRQGVGCTSMCIKYSDCLVTTDVTTFANKRYDG